MHSVLNARERKRETIDGFPKPPRSFPENSDSDVISVFGDWSSIDANRIDPERSIFLDDHGDPPTALVNYLGQLRL